MDIIDKDPIKAKMDTLGLSAYDSLAFAFTSPGYSLSAIDTFALQYTYCLTNIDEAQEFCEEFYATEIAQMEFPNAYFKDAYYEKMLGMYLTNRQQYKHFLNPQFSSASCTCPYQMELSGPGLNVFFDPYEHWMNNPYFTDSLGFDFNNIIDSFLLNNPGDTTGLAQIQDSVQYLYDSVNTVNCVARVDYIFSNFSSCGPEVNLSALKDFFIGICSDNSEVLSDYLEPEIFDSLFTAFGIVQDAFCHVYLLDFISPNGSSGQSGNDFSCLFPVDFYADWEQFLMSLSLEQYPYLSGSQSYSLDTQNYFEKELSFHLGTVIQVVSSYQNSILNLHFTNGIDTISQFIPIENMSATINNLQFKVACALEQENISSQIVQGYLLSQMVVVTAAIDQQIYKTHAWISSPFLSLRPEAGGIERAITPKVLLSAWDSYEQWAKPYGLTHRNHPLFAKSLTNFLNYKWKKHFDYTAIPQYIESVELHKKRTILSTGSYGVLRFSNSTSLENFTNYLFTTFGHTEMVAWKEDNNKVGVDLREVADSLYRGLDSVLQNYNNGVEERWINLPFLHSIEDSNTYAVLYVDPSSYSTPLNSLTVFGTQVDWSIVSQGSVLLEWQNENASNYHKYLIKYQGQNEAELSNLAMYIEDFMENHAINYRLLNHRPLLRYIHNQSMERTAFLQKAFSSHLMHNLQSYDSLQIPALKDNPFNNYDYIAYGPSFSHLNKSDLYYNSDLEQEPAWVEFKTKMEGVRDFLVLEHINVGVFIFSICESMDLIPNNTLSYFNNSRNIAWYRSFDPDSDVLQNIWIAYPEYMDLELLSSFIYYELLPTLSADSVNNDFHLLLQTDSLSTHALVLKGQKSFSINSKEVVFDALLHKGVFDSETEDDRFNHCERNRLNAAILEGRILYAQYIDSIRQAEIQNFTAHLQNEISEELQMKYFTSRFAYTLYSYDLAGNVLQTIPPMGVDTLDQNVLSQVDAHRSSGTGTLKPEHKKQSIYHYNSLNQKVYQFTPDGMHEVYFYDALGRIVFSQNSQQAKEGFFSYLLYDALGRMYETGEMFTGIGTSTPLQDTLHYDPLAITGVLQNAPTFMTQLHNLDMDAIAQEVENYFRREVIYTVYDSAWIDLGVYEGLESQKHLRNRISSVLNIGTVSANAPISDTSTWSYAMHFSYDISGNVTTLIRDYPAIGSFFEENSSSQRFKRIDYEYDLITGKVHHVAYHRGHPDQYFQKYSYDADERIVQVESSRDGVIWDKDVN